MPEMRPLRPTPLLVVIAIAIARQFLPNMPSRPTITPPVASHRKLPSFAILPIDKT